MFTAFFIAMGTGKEMRISIVLVAPARAENVGAAARAMKTMGFSEMRIVDSRAHLEPAAGWVAHGSGDVLDKITCYQTLEEALADVDGALKIEADHAVTNLSLIHI